jgi:hypothetical protein
MIQNRKFGTIAAMLVGACLIIFGAGSYILSRSLNESATTAGNSASAPNSPGRINEQPARDQGTPRKPPLQDTNVPPAGRPSP